MIKFVLLTALTVQSPASPALTECSVAGVSGAVECGTLSVFEDRENLSGRKIDLKVVVIRATSDPLPDPLVSGGRWTRSGGHPDRGVFMRRPMRHSGRGVTWC